MTLVLDFSFWFWAVILPALVIIGLQVWVLIEVRRLRG
jgi:hypothetical protein